ncbi:MAG: ATP-binding protein [Coriobacteriales bacterium]
MAVAPFKVGGIVEPPYFVGREDELQALVAGARSLSQNLLILGPRRHGKSSLLHNLKTALAGERDLLVPFVNCLEVTNYADLHRAMVDAVIEEYAKAHRLAGWGEMLRALVKEGVLAALRRVDEIGGSVGEVGRIYLRFREKEVDQKELLRGAFAFFHAFTKEKHVRILFLLDEFQEAANLNGYLFQLLKQEIDRTPDVRYIFSGSSVRMLTSIFLKQDAPLYLMVARHMMGPLGEADVVAFVRERLGVAGLSISEDAARALHRLSGGIPFYVQKLGLLVAQAALLAKRKRVSEGDVVLAFAQMLEELEGEFEVRWVSRLSSQQRAIVKQVARAGSIRMSELASQMGVTAPAISSAMRRLKDMMILQTDDAGAYSATDAVFGAWLARQ